MKITKKWFIDLLRNSGFKARYSNIYWFYNFNFFIVGGKVSLPFNQFIYFCINKNKDDIILGCDYDLDIKPLIYCSKI